MRWVLWLYTFSLLACVHSAPHATGPAQRSLPAEDSAFRAAYSSEPTPGVLLGEAVDETLAQTLAQACADRQLAVDGRLSELARAVARATGGEAPSAALVSFHAQRLGLTDPTPQLWLANTSATSAVLAPLTAAVQRATGLENLTHCGGAAVLGGHGVIVAVALSRRLATFQTAVPRRIEVGDSVVLNATLAPGYGDASLAITLPSGAVKRVPLGSGRALKSRQSFDAPGAVTLEILASGAEGVTVVALLALSVGVEPSREAPVSQSEAGESQPEEVAEALALLIARERKQRGLPALTLHPGLRAVALAHSADMLANHFVAHTSPTTGEAQDRVARAGLRGVVLLENIGRGYSAAEIHAGLMESPGHRANILNADVRSLGIGVGAEPEGVRLAFVATQLFARLAEATNFQSAPRDLFEAIEARRKPHKLPRLSLDASLSRLAQSAADSFAENPQANEDALLARVSRGVRTLPRGAGALSAALVQAEELAQVADSEQLLASELVALGIGVAALPRGSSRHLAVVLLLALKR